MYLVFSIIVQRFGPDFNKLKIGFIAPKKSTSTKEKIRKNEKKKVEENVKQVNRSDKAATLKPTTALKSTSKASASPTSMQATTPTPTQEKAAVQNRKRRDVKAKKLKFNTTYLPLYSRTTNKTIEYYGNVSMGRGLYSISILFASYVILQISPKCGTC